MPDYTFYYGTTSGSSDPISADEVLRMWTEYELSVDCDKEQRQQEEEELREDKRKYPLFYWKELTK